MSPSRIPSALVCWLCPQPRAVIWVQMLSNLQPLYCSFLVDLGLWDLCVLHIDLKMEAGAGSLVSPGLGLGAGRLHPLAEHLNTLRGWI